MTSPHTRPGVRLGLRANLPQFALLVAVNGSSGGCGWLFAIPVPLLLIWAPTWGWVVLANVLLGVNQGLAWSVTVIMKIDLVGPRRRGAAMGFSHPPPPAFCRTSTRRWANRSAGPSWSKPSPRDGGRSMTRHER